MPYPRKLLNEGEEIVLETRPNWSLLVAPTLFGVLVVAGLVAALIAWSSMPLWVGGVIGAAFLVDVGFVLSRYAVWRATLLVVTTHRVIYRTGVLARRGREIPIDRVQDVSFRQSIFERMVGAGSLTVESAGEHGQEPFPDVAHPERVQSTINRLLEMHNQRDLQRATGQPVLSIPDEIEKLGELYRRGILTQDEFEQKKAELLHRM